ncbi:MAG: hypothetical protein JW861_03535 [Bacteroidales bacterium]|nr:hypothetical protein [Bacteroidales bacterium]
MTGQYKNIDDLFRDKFRDFELDPPDHIWENVRREVSGSGGGTTLSKGGVAGVIAVLIMLGGLVTFLSLREPVQLSDTSRLAGEVSQAVTTVSDAVDFPYHSAGLPFKPEHFGTVDEQMPQQGIRSESPVNIRNTVPASESAHTAIRPQAKVLPSASDYRNITSEKKASNSSLSMRNKVAIATTLEAVFPDYSQPRATGGVVYDLDNGNRVTSISEPFFRNKSDFKTSFIRRPSFSAGLTFLPEIIFFPSDEMTSGRRYSADLAGIYRFGDYLLQSGAGIAFSDDDGDYSVNYEKYLGSYEDVYDITFDSTENGVAPTYHTQTVHVYDSVRHVSISKTSNRYTYLQVPLLFGYCRDYRRVSWFIKGGPSFSLLIHKQIPGVDVPYQDIRIVGVDSRMPERISTSWQLLISAGLEYQLSHSMGIVFEPTIRYYMNSGYKSHVLDTRHPYALGIRTGFLIHF